MEIDPGLARAHFCPYGNSPIRRLLEAAQVDELPLAHAQTHDRVRQPLRTLGGDNPFEAADLSIDGAEAALGLVSSVLLGRSPSFLPSEVVLDLAPRDAIDPGPETLWTLQGMRVFGHGQERLL